MPENEVVFEKRLPSAEKIACEVLSLVVTQISLPLNTVVAENVLRSKQVNTTIRFSEEELRRELQQGP